MYTCLFVLSQFRVVCLGFYKMNRYIIVCVSLHVGACDKIVEPTVNNVILKLQVHFRLYGIIKLCAPQNHGET